MTSCIITFYWKVLLSQRSRRGLLLLLLTFYISLALASSTAATLLNHKISGTLPADGDVTQFKISSDGYYAVFVADARVPGIPELFSASMGGGPRIPLTPPLPSGAAVLGFAITPDSRRVVYWTGPNAGRPDRLYSVPITGGEQADLTSALVPDTYLADVAIATGSQHVVYQSVSPPTTLPHIETNLWTVMITGGTPTKINDRCNGKVSLFQMIPDGSGVAYMTGGTPPCGLYSFSFSGTQVKLVEFGYLDFAVTPDGSRVVYYDAFGPSALFSIPITGGESTQITGLLTADPYSLDFKISPDSERVVYRADSLLAGRMELFSVPTVGGEPEKRLTTGIIDTGDVVDYQITPNSQGVVYRADKEVEERIDLYAVTMDGLLTFKLNGDMDANRDVSSFAITPNSLGVVFTADKNEDEKNELFAVYINGTGLRTLNTNPFPANRDVLDFQITPNNLGVVYRADQETNDVFNLYLVSIFGGTPIRLNGPLVAGGNVATFSITPDGMGVAYLADQERDGVDELYTTFDRQIVYLPLILR